jgi:hypothetical protein
MFTVVEGYLFLALPYIFISYFSHFLLRILLWQLLISGSVESLDIDDLRLNTNYSGGYHPVCLLCYVGKAIISLLNNAAGYHIVIDTRRWLSFTHVGYPSIFNN